MAELEGQIAGLAALDEPLRRSLYLYVSRTSREVGREEAAAAAGTTRRLAAFHLDRLADEGLLEVSFRRLSGRSGPGAGRPAKLYRRAERQLEVSLPPRRYELAARILADTVAAQAPAREALRRTAHAAGERIGAEARERAGRRPGRRRLLAATLAALAAHGYEPAPDAGALRLRNCPFHGLVDGRRELVCGMNLALLEGVVAGLGLAGARPVLDPAPGNCCVRLDLAPGPPGAEGG